MNLKEAMAKMRERQALMRAWLNETAPYILVEQKHLDENTVERAYWHYGYQAALGDALNLLSK